MSPRAGRVLMLGFAVAALTTALGLYWAREVDPSTCESRCTREEACMRALDAEGIAPYGSTRGDRGLCNGICSALRSQVRQTRRAARELGFDDPGLGHPCLPPPVK